jgi:hypothetical protein
MEDLVTTLKTSRLLEAAEFPIDPVMAWFPDQNETYHMDEVEDDDWFVAPYDGEERCVRAFSAQEIADQLPGSDLYRVSRVSRGTWVAYNHDDWRVNKPSGDGPTMAEALAALWLKLQEPPK